MENENKEQFMRIFQAFALIKEAKVLEHLKDADIIKLLLFCDNKGWMHYDFDGIKILLVGCAYNVKEFDPKTQHKLPEKSEGHIMFVPFIASRTKDKFKFKKMMSGYLKDNPETSEIVYYKDDEETPTVYKLKGEKSGKKERVLT